MVAEGMATAVASHLRFALAKFRPTTLPVTLVTRSVLQDRLTAGAGKRLTVVVGSAGAGKSVLLSSWAATWAPGITSWLSCDEADANPTRFWTGFIEAPRGLEPGFGADAADLLAMDGAVSADVTASIANDAAKLPAGSALTVDDFQHAAPAVGANMTDLVERWPAETAQLVLASRSDPPCGCTSCDQGRIVLRCGHVTLAIIPGLVDGTMPAIYHKGVRAKGRTKGCLSGRSALLMAWASGKGH
jgi:ATP/maltotriose-dependent transcriptional regulator MalT